MNRIWNTFCEDIRKNRGVKEISFEKDIVKGFLQALGWSRYERNLEEQYGLYSRKWIPDFVFYLNNDKNAKEIILELKKPDHKQRKVDIEQIEAYMKLTDCRFGLYFGEKLEVFYLREKEGKRSAMSVTIIDWSIDNKAGVNLIELLDYRHYDRNKLEQFCLEHIELNSFLHLWKTPRGQQQLYDGIIKHFMLPPAMADSLHSFLKFSIIDNLESDSQPTSTTPAIPSSIPTKNIQSKLWLICYDNAGFDVESCFKKYGQVYWKHKNNLVNIQKGDYAYLYANSPQSAIRFKVEIVESGLPYSPIMDKEDEFSKKGVSYDNDEKYKYFVVRPIAETQSQALKHAAMMSMGLIGNRPSTTILSKGKYKPLKEYIEQHFDDATPIEEKVFVPKKKAQLQKQEKAKAKLNRRPPFKFSMIGLKPGDVIYFEHGDLPVTVISENTIVYDNETFTLSRFCKRFMPKEGSEGKEYQGPAHFTYNGKKLDVIRKEIENKS